MRITWLQPWFHRRWAPTTPTLAAAVSRWPFSRRNRLPNAFAPLARNSPCSDRELVSPQRVAVSLPHHLDVAAVTQYLLQELDCDGWYVACRHDHQMVVRLTREGVARYAISYDCSPPVEKGVYHGSRAWAMTLIPLRGEDNLPQPKVEEIEAGLAKLHA